MLLRIICSSTPSTSSSSTYTSTSSHFFSFFVSCGNPRLWLAQVVETLALPRRQLSYNILSPWDSTLLPQPRLDMFVTDRHTKFKLGVLSSWTNNLTSLPLWALTTFPASSISSIRSSRETNKAQAKPPFLECHFAVKRLSNQNQWKHFKPNALPLAAAWLRVAAGWPSRLAYLVSICNVLHIINCAEYIE